MRELFITRAAEADILEIWTYLFENSEQAADRVIDQLSEKFDLLLAFPFSGRRRPEIGERYRSLAVGNYVVFYRVSDTKMEIARVLHGARDLSVFLFDTEDENQE